MIKKIKFYITLKFKNEWKIVFFLRQVIRNFGREHYLRSLPLTSERSLKSRAHARVQAQADNQSERRLPGSDVFEMSNSFLSVLGLIHTRYFVYDIAKKRKICCDKKILLSH